MAPVLKTGGRKPLQVRILCPPYHVVSESRFSTPRPHAWGPNICRSTRPRKGRPKRSVHATNLRERNSCGLGPPHTSLGPGLAAHHDMRGSLPLLTAFLLSALASPEPVRGQSAPPPALPAAPVEAVVSYDTVFNSLRNLAPRPDRVATVHGGVLRRDVMELRLDAGTLSVLTSVAGRAIGVAFVGAGSVSFVPPLEVERANLRRVLGDSLVSGPIAGAVLIFADSTLGELERSVTFGAGPPGDAAGFVSDALDYLVDGRERSADASLMTALLSETTSGFFAAYVKRTRGEGVLVEINPNEAEEVQLLRRGRLVGQRVETVCQFQRAEDLRGNAAVVTEHPEPMEVDAYGLDATIDGNYKFSARATVRVNGRRDR